MKNLDIQKIVRNNMPWLILLVVSIIFSFISPNFFSIANIINTISTGIILRRKARSTCRWATRCR